MAGGAASPAHLGRVLHEAHANPRMSTLDYRTGIRLTHALAEGEGSCLELIEGSADFEAEAFPAFLKAHNLREWFAPIAGSERGRKILPEGLVAELEAIRRGQPLRVEALVRLCEETQAAFRGVGIQALFLKGLYLAERFYGDLERRQQYDVDVLVRPDDCEPAVKALATLGFDTTTEHATVRREEIRTIAPKHAPGTITLRRPDGMRLDLHVRTKSRWFHGIDERAYWSDRRSVRVGGCEFDTLSDEHTLVLLLASICADLRRGASRAKHFLDLYLVLRAFEPSWDWEAFLERRRREGLLKTSVNALALFLTLWDCADEFPDLAQALERRRRHIEIRSPEEALALVSRPRRSLENLAWYRRLGSRTTLGYLRWSLFQDLPHTLSRGAASLRPGGPAVPWRSPGSPPPA